MKSAGLFWFGLALLLCLQADILPLAAAPAAPRYTDTEHHFSLVPPAAWIINMSLIPHYAVFVEPDKPRQTEPTTLGTFGSPARKLTLEQYVISTRQEVLKEKGLTIYEEKEILLGGVKAHSWRMHVALPDHSAHENRQVFCVHNQQTVILTLTGLPQTIKKYDGDFDRVVASFRWEAVAAATKK